MRNSGRANTNSNSDRNSGSSDRSGVPEALRLVVLGGFLGAGKTTCLGEIVKRLQERGLRPGVVTNDQGVGLVDTELGRDFTRSRGSSAAVRQVTGGCFCCRVDSLVEALGQLSESSRPDVFVVEPVGSCTDLMATVMLPLQQVYHSNFVLAPLSVVVDAVRAAPIFGISSQHPRQTKKKRTRSSTGRKSSSGGKGFSKEVNYIYRKQLEEAEILVVNKIDLLGARARKDLLARLGEEYPDKRILEISARTGQGVDDWFEVLIERTSQPDTLIELDYNEYAAGEARLGWFNADLSAHAIGNDFDGNRLLLSLAQEIRLNLEVNQIELAHFKMSLSGNFCVGEEGRFEPTGDQDNLAVVNAVRNGAKAELSTKMDRRITVGELLINLRAEGDPEQLANIVEWQLERPRKDAKFVLREKAAFRPARPEPVHRATSLQGS